MGEASLSLSCAEATTVIEVVWPVKENFGFRDRTLDSARGIQHQPCVDLMSLATGR